MIDANVAIALATSVGSMALIIWHGGKQVGKVEAAIGRLVGIEVKLEKIQTHEVKLGILENQYTTLRSDHRELKRVIDDLKDDTGVIRGRLESQHDLK